MKKHTKRIICSVLLILISISLIACSKKSVLVYTNGGDVALPEEISELEQVVSTIPTKEGMIFVGWYSDAGFTDYINPQNITDAQKEKNTAYAKWIEIPKETEYLVREAPVTINDSGCNKQQMDCISLIDNFDIVDLTRAGYTSMKFTITLDVCEKDDGYQYVLLYRDTNCTLGEVSVSSVFSQYVLGESQDDPSMLYLHKFEHNPGVADNSWGTVTFSATIPLSDIKGNVYIRYDASGNNEDDWLNKNVKALVVPIK